MKQVITGATPHDEISERELAHRELARRVAAESIVLLKNDGVLPLKKPSGSSGDSRESSPIALFGAGGRTTIKGGTGSGEVNERYSVTIEQGLINAGFIITTTTWLSEYEQLLAKSKKTAYRAVARRVLSSDPDVRINIMADAFQYPTGRIITKEEIEVSRTDTCVYVIARLAGECSERSLDGKGYYLAEEEIRNLKIVSECYENTIVVINASGPLDLRPLDDIEGINAILFFCMQGMEGGNALADILLGDANPSGCLSFTWPEQYKDIPLAMEYSNLNGNTTSEEYREGIYVGYRYFDSFGTMPRYAFGYGLSYTDFSLSGQNVTINKELIEVTAAVTNVGSTYSGASSVQLYVSAPSGKLNREYQSLAAFTKTRVLAPGESEVVTLNFALTELAGYDEEQAVFMLEQGDYILRLGKDSMQTEAIALIGLDETVITERCTPVCALEQELEEIVAPPQAEQRGKEQDLASGKLQRLVFDTTAITPLEHDYQTPSPALSSRTTQILEELETEDLLKLVIATGFIDNNPAVSVCGAAAYTTSHLVKKGVPNAALCDGPAGLRLNRAVVRLKNGRIRPVESNFELLDYAPWLLRAYLLAKPSQGKMLYQNTSAFPVGTALAQTWNTELIEQVGTAIGREMVEFGATYLLAPGMNIQRNPLCGRNYEYYSEDPLLTGKLTAALTRGVQSFDGCYVTLKHYAANNQETNRNRSNSIVRERTLREIYLKAFKIAVEEGGAKGVMTSYNLLNGVYTPNSHDLCTKLLRCEWGFEGVVMTDWFSTDKGLASNGLAIKAGNDLICPGSKDLSKALREDFENGVVSSEDLKLSAARILEAVINGRTGMLT